MFTLIEKIYLLKLLKKKGGLFKRISKEDRATHQQLVDKLEQMIRNEQANKKFL